MLLHTSVSNPITEVVQMKQKIRKIAARSALFFGVLAVSIAGMRLAVRRNAENAPDTYQAAASQTPVIVLDAGHGEST